MRQHRDPAGMGGGEVPGDATEQQRVGDAVAHGVEEGAARTGGAGGLGHRAVEHVGQRAEHEEQEPGAERAVGDGDRRPPPASTTPMAVRWSAVMPVRRRLAPTGLRPSSKLVRQRPSNIRPGYLGVLSHPCIAPQGPQDAPPPGEQQVVAAVRGEVEDGVRAAGRRARCPPAAARSRRATPWKVRTGQRDGRQVEPALELALDVAGQPVGALLDARLQTGGQRVDRPRAPGPARRGPTSPASSSTWARAIAASSGSGRGRAPPRRPARRRACRGRSPRRRGGRRPSAAEHVRVVVGLGRRQRADQPERREPSAERRRDVAAPSAASPPPDQPSRTARSTPDRVEQARRGRRRARPGWRPDRRRCHRSPAGPPPAAAHRPRPSPASSGRPRRESGVPWRYTTGTPSGSPTSS